MDEAALNIRFINFDQLQRRSSFPRYPNDRSIATTLIDIEFNDSFIVFISHCWLRGYAGADGWTGTAHPDNTKNEKFDLTVKGVELAWRTLAPGMRNCYVWFDYSCINQNEDPAGELRDLRVIIESCDCMFTPIVDHKYDSWKLVHTTAGTLSDYKAEAWQFGEHSYVNRSWCRMEMYYAAHTNLRSSSKDLRLSKFKAGLKYHNEHGRRPHLLYGTRESLLFNCHPIILPPLQNSYLNQYNPADGSITKHADRAKIAELMLDLPPKTIESGYTGEKNDAGEFHGSGKLVMPNGDVYEGQFINGLKHGAGVYTLASGFIYEGQFQQDKKCGYGKFTYASGDTYEGHYVDDKKCGFGKAHYSSGNYCEGHFVDDRRNGLGTFVWANGNRFDGNFVDDKMDGLGTLTYANGDVYEGTFLRDQRNGNGVLRNKRGDIIFDGQWENDTLIMPNSLVKDTILSHSDDLYGGVIVSEQIPSDIQTFKMLMTHSLNQWKSAGKRAVWLRLSNAHAISGYVTAAAEQGFKMHSVIGEGILLLTKWLGPAAEYSLPPAATYYLGVGCVCIHEKNILVVKEKDGPLNHFWKIPTGFAETSEDIPITCIREICEETGIKAEFVGVVMLRQMHSYFHDKGDLFVICLTRPTNPSQLLRSQNSEVEGAKWLPIEEYVEQPFFQRSPLYQKINERIIAVSEGSNCLWHFTKLDSGWKGDQCLYHP